jgi:sialic acid synthase SpsE/sugar phosphate isomerase/epimerase
VNKKTIYTIAEIGVNHNGNLDTALQLIEKSKEAGVNAVKFQKRNLEEIYSKKILNDPNSAEWNFEYLIPLLKEVELSESDYLVIKDKCDELSLDLIITPFDKISAEFVGNLGVSKFKISSADMTNFDLIDKCNSYGLPLIISTGMWKYKDIKKCVEYYKKNNINFSLLLANSTYPTPYEEIPLNIIKKLKKLSNEVGYSGHEHGIFVPIAAIALGATIIEKHITLDRNQKGPDHVASLLPSEFKSMVENIRELEKSLGDTKMVNQAETLNKEVFAKSAVSVNTLHTGHQLLQSDVEFKSPGKGIFPHEIDEFYGKKLKREVSKGDYISINDFKKLLEIKNWDKDKFNFSKRWGVKCRFHDYEQYKVLKAPVMEFHLSETDLNIDFNEKNNDSELVIHAPEVIGRRIFDLCSANSEVLDLSFDILQRTIDKTIEISKNWNKSKPRLVVHMGGMSLYKVEPYNRVLEDKMSRVIDNFKKINYSRDDIEIIPENLPSRPWYLGGEWHQYSFSPASDMIQFCDYFDLKMTYDICHAKLYCNDYGVDLMDYTKSIKNYISHLHISDALGINAEGLQIGTGEIDFESLFKIISDVDYSWVTEIWSGHLHNGEGTHDGMCCLNKNYAKYL